MLVFSVKPLLVMVIMIISSGIHVDLRGKYNDGFPELGELLCNIVTIGTRDPFRRE
jgi:hypothetical protein